MNLGHRLSQWFAAEFGSTQCGTITGCDFSAPLGVRRYIKSNGTARCREVARGVARRVKGPIDSDEAARAALATC